MPVMFNQMVQFDTLVFPGLLLFLMLVSLVFLPHPGARAITFFAIGYFSTVALFKNGFFPDYGDKYHPLIFASALTILLYHTLDITPALFTAWIMELVLITLNIGMIWQIGITPMQHWTTTVILNALELIVLLGGCWYGNLRILYSRLFDLDIPIGLARAWHRASRPEGEG